MQKVIVTGATGFIGYALLQKLSCMQIQVYAIVRENSTNLFKIENLPNVKIIFCNLDNIEDIKERINNRGFDVFFHMAWQGVSDIDAENIDIQLSNVKSACKAVEVASALKCKKFVFASSIMEYEIMKLMQTNLDAGMRNIYRTAKITASYMTRIVANNVGIDYNAAVISNVYGEGEVSKRFINVTLRKMLNGERTRFTEAKQLYDFIYIDDAVEMMLLIAEKGRKNINYYLGSMYPRPLREFIYEMRDCVDEKLELGIGESKQYVGVSLDYNEFDIKACYKDFGFTPRYSFKEGIKKTIKWLMKQEVLNEDN